jgi:hypothetical protein
VLPLITLKLIKEQSLQKDKMFSLKKENLHHAYLVKMDAGSLDDFLAFLETLGFKTKANPNFLLKKTQSFSIDDAREVKDFQNEKAEDRKLIVIATEYFSHDAQHAMLKVLEEPKSGVHFFILTKNTEILLPTLKSRLIDLEAGQNEGDADLQKLAQKFLEGDQDERYEISQKILKKFEKEENPGLLKSYVVSFLNSLEIEIAKREDKKNFDLKLLWKIKDYIHDQGASVKNLLETLALTF